MFIRSGENFISNRLAIHNKNRLSDIVLEHKVFVSILVHKKKTSVIPFFKQNKNARKIRISQKLVENTRGHSIWYAMYYLQTYYAKKFGSAMSNVLQEKGTRSLQEITGIPARIPIRFPARIPQDSGYFTLDLAGIRSLFLFHVECHTKKPYTLLKNIRMKMKKN